jgi:hypothetical protein
MIEAKIGDKVYSCLMDKLFPCLFIKGNRIPPRGYIVAAFDKPSLHPERHEFI